MDTTDRQLTFGSSFFRLSGFKPRLHRRAVPAALLGAWLLCGCPGGGGADSPSAGQPTNPSPGSGSTAVALNVRLQGLALGGQLGLAHGAASLTATLNQPYQFTPQVAAGSPLDLRVTSQPAGQTCGLSSLAPAVVPSDASSVFVRCTSDVTARVSMPATSPDEALSVTLGLREVAYPGLPYESRLGLIGGIFPYEYRLKSFTRDGVAQSTSGLTIDFRRGTVRFTPSVEGRYELTLSVADSGSVQKTMDYTAVIQVAASSFVFVAPDGQDAAGRGSLALPFKTPAYALAHALPEQVVMLRKGRYAMASLALNDNAGKQLLAYPDEVASLDFGYAGGISVRNTALPAARVEGVDLLHTLQYGIASDPSTAGLVVRQVRFIDGAEGSSPRENPAFIHGRGDLAAAWRHKLLVQDNDFGTLAMTSSGAYALTLFDAGETLVENNQIRLGATTGGIHDKDNSQHNTYRENYIEFSPEHSTGSGIQVAGQANADRVHIHHNLLVQAGIFLGVQCFDPACYMRDLHVHHNTVAGQQVSMNWGPFNPTSYGTSVDHNIISSGASAPFAGLSCQAGLPSGFSAQLTSGANLLESTSALAFKDTECTRNDTSWATWQSTLGMDTAASGSTRTTTSALVGTGPTTGLPAGDARRSTRGHLYR